MSRRAGFSLVELTIVLVIAGLLALMAVPEMSVAMETATVDEGVATLHSLWLAERMYRLEEGEFSPSIADLEEAGLIRASVLDRNEEFRYRIVRVSISGAEIEARRDTATGWSGALSLDEKGEIDGSTARGGHVVRP